MGRMKRLAGAFVAGVLFSGIALAQPALRPGDADPYASKPGAANTYAPRAGDPNPYEIKAGTPSSVRHTRDDRRPPAEEKGYGFARDPHGTHLPYGTNQGTSTRRR